MNRLVLVALFSVLCGFVCAQSCREREYQLFTQACHDTVKEEIGSLADITDSRELKEPICKALRMMELCYRVSARMTSCHVGPTLDELERDIEKTKTWLRENKNVEC